MIPVVVMVCLQVNSATESAPVTRFFEALKVSVISDPLPALPFIPVRDPKRKPEDLVREFARQNKKSVEKIDSLFVLRDLKPSPESGATQASVPVALQRFPKLKLGDLPVPAQSVSLAAPNLSLEKLAEVLREDALWDVQVAQALRSRRLFVHVTQVSVGDLLQGVGRLASAGPRVLLETTAVQEAMQDDATDTTEDKWKRRMRASDALREELEQLLTPEQKERNLKKGEFIRIGLSDMPAPLREKALEYIKLAVGISQAFGTDLDLSKVNQFGVRFRPPQSGVSWRELGVHVVGTDGYECYL